MTMIKVNFGAAITNWNATTSAGAGTRFADLLDDGGSATGIAFSNAGAYSHSGTDRATGDFHGLPEAYWDGLFFQSGAMQFTLSGLTAYSGQSYTLTTAHFSNSARDNDVTVDGTTLQYNSVAGDPVTPLTFTGTIGGDTLVIDIALVSGTTTTYFQGFTLELVASPSRSITNIDGDNNVQAGQTNITVTTVGMDSAPTVKTATLGGESLTVVSAGETSWVVSVPLHIDLEWGSTTNDLVLTDDTGSVTLNNVTLSAPTGWETVAFTTAPNPTTTESFYEYAQTDTGLGGAGYTMLAGDILAWETQTGLTIDGQTKPQVDPPATVSGSYKVFKDATKTWTSVSTFTINDLGFPGASLTPATTIYVNMSNTGVDLPNVPAPWSYNNFIATKGTSVQQITADLKDLDNVSTSLTLDTINPFTGAIGSAGNADAAVGDWAEEVFEYAWYTGATESPSKLRIGGLVNGDTFRIEVAGHQGTQPTRDTGFTVGGQAGTYDNSGTATPTAPLVLTGTVSGTTLDIDAALVDSFGYFTGFKLEINGGASSIPPESRTSIFHIANYLRSLGTYNSSQCNELVVEWLVSEGITRTQINQMLYGYLGGLGYTGSFNDRLKAWSEDV